MKTLTAYQLEELHELLVETYGKWTRKDYEKANSYRSPVPSGGGHNFKNGQVAKQVLRLVLDDDDLKLELFAQLCLYKEFRDDLKEKHNISVIIED